MQLKKIHNIRWLSRQAAIEAEVKTYEVLVLYFKNLSNSDVVAAGLVKHLKNY